MAINEHLTLVGYFLSGKVTSKVYVNNQQPIHELKDKIRGLIHEVEPQLCSYIIKMAIHRRLTLCKNGHNAHFPYIIFCK